MNQMDPHIIPPFGVMNMITLEDPSECDMTVVWGVQGRSRESQGCLLGVPTENLGIMIANQ